MHDLTVIVPVYNEGGIINDVIQEWINMLDKLEIKYKIKIFNDGSTDNTQQVLDELKDTYKEVLLVIHKNNEGHGPTISRGYKESIDTEWLFQFDSDNEISPDYFPEFWKARNDYDLIIGKRLGRKNSISRKLMSKVSFLLVSSCFGKGINDVNAPFRLIRNCIYQPYLQQIPTTFFAPNILLSGIATKNNMRIKNIPVKNNSRTLDKPSFKENKFKLFKVSLRSSFEIIQYAFGRKS